MRFRPPVLALIALIASFLPGCSSRRPPVKPDEPVASAATQPVPVQLLVQVVRPDGSPADFVDVRVDGAVAMADLADEAGEARFVVTPGRWLASASSEGFVSDAFEIEVTAGSQQAVRVPLRAVPASFEMVEVHAAVAEQEEVRIPIGSRPIGDLVPMMPGIVGPSGWAGTSIGGGSSANVAYRLDGQDANDAVDGGLALQVPAAAMQSFKTISSGASARYGEQSTGVAEVVTREGHVGGVIGGTIGSAMPVAAEPAPDVPFPVTGPRPAQAGFTSPLDEPLSTFGIDVDTGSYAIVRESLRHGALPDPGHVRIEEIVNAFTYDDPAPARGDGFAATTEIAACPWAPAHDLVRISLKGEVVDRRDAPPMNLVFLVDVSGSMQSHDKLPLVQESLKLLVRTLRPEDTVGLVVYAGAAGVVLEPASDQAAITAAVDRLQAGGSTAGAAGIQAAYALAGRHFRKGGANRVVLCTDGDFNVGVSSEAELVRLIEAEREKGVFLSVLGFGDGNYQDAKMEQLADHGNGNYAYVDDLREARRVLVDQGMGTLLTIAKDVKIQVEMNPARVAKYRLVGYENRLMPAAHFADDSKDGGEIGAGHVVTALYEIVPATLSNPATRASSRLRYQEGPEPRMAAAHPEELMTLRVRWKQPDGVTSDVIEEQVLAEDVAFGSASDDFRWAACAASFAQLLRGSDPIGSFGWDDLAALAPAAVGSDPDGRRAEMIALAGTARAMQPARVSAR